MARGDYKYDDSMPDKLIEHMKEGYSFESFGAIANVHRSCLYQWLEKHEDFREAKELATVKSLFQWEKMGMEGMYMGGKDNPFNSTVWVFNMKNRFGWSDRKEDSKEDTKTEITVKFDQGFDE